MHTVTLSITNKNVPVRLDVVQYTTAPDIGFVIDDYTPTGRADIYIKKPSGEEIYNHCTIDGNTIIFTPTTQCFAEVGENKAMLQILDGEKLAVSFKIWFIVEENFIDSSAAESQSEFTELQDAISTIGQYDQRIQDVQDAMTALDTELTEDMADLQTAVTNQLNAAVTELNEDMDGLDGRLTTAENNIEQLTDSGFIYRRQLTSADDLNDIKTVGIYWYATGDVPVNAYTDYASVVEVIMSGASNSRIIQRSTRYGPNTGNSAFRTLSTGTWNEWRRYATNTDISSINTSISTLESRTDQIAINLDNLRSTVVRQSGGNARVSGDFVVGRNLTVDNLATFDHDLISGVPSITSAEIAMRLPALGGGGYNGSTSIADQSVPSNTAVQNLGSVVLQPGTYLLYFFVAWSSNATGRRYINLADTPTTQTGTCGWLRDSQNAVNGGITTNRIVAPFTTNGTKKLYLNCIQNSGSTLTAQIRWCAVSIDKPF